jgi:CRP-like cAMP-binding protein
MHEYAPISDSTFTDLLACSRLITLDKGEFYCVQGSMPTEFGFVALGLLRYYTCDEEGNEYNKVFFDEGTFPGAIAALLTGQPANVAIQALEPCELVSMHFAGFRRILQAREDLKWFQIQYLEANWLLKKEPREFALVQEEASDRYRRFQQESPGLAARLPLFHIASHLGITPTQLSRIRRSGRGSDDEEPSNT